MSMYQSESVSEDPIIDEAARAPIILFDYSASNQDDAEREPGLILTKEQLKNIKRYEIAGLALPIELKNVIDYLGYSTGAGRGLEAVDFQQTFKLIHAHASSWNPLRVDLISVGHKLQLFAGEIQIHNSTMLEIRSEISKLNVLDEYDIKTAEDVRKLETSLGSKFPGINLDASDTETVKEVGYYLEQIIENIRQQAADAESIKARLDTFANALSDNVRPALQLKLRAIENNTLSDEIKAINDIIEKRANDIDEKNREYKEAVKQAVGSAASFNIIGLFMSIYIGVEAERIRKERDALKLAQTRDIAAMQTKSRVLGSLNRVRLDLQDLDIIVIDADIATKNLVTVWNKLSAYANRSLQQVDTLNNALTVRQFFNAFKLVAAPWNDIEKNANDLLAVFAQADKEFRDEYQSLPNRQSPGV